MLPCDFTNWKQNLGSNLRKLRKSRGQTQAQLAELLEVDTTTISKMENSVIIPGLNTVIEISIIYGISIDNLLSASK
ncbi:MAG: helix-turn-helix domain-containing protein [Acidaminobacter sp.]|uniref:helix-turn-helix domain-containing protein n=1 Tax=Acidaminobacter sp. TaxID=1872102 RepID=UPI0013864418|nr:helix-turn-helix domain-containing protein [Acidaminobacter sp.]